MAELLRAEALRRRFRDGGLGLDGASLTIGEGDFLLLAGRNGSGKSLLARHLAGLAQAESGRVLWRGGPLGRDSSPLRRGLGLVFQDAEAQILGQTLLEDACFGPANLGLPPAELRARGREALALVGLAGLAERSVEGLSGGEKRRLAIAGLLALRPECLLLDEPFANLDFPAIRSLLRLIVELHAGGRTIVVITHEIEKVLAHATKLAVMEAGRVVYEGEPEGLPGPRYEEFGLRNPFRSGLGLGELTWLD